MTATDLAARPSPSAATFGAGVLRVIEPDHLPTLFGLADGRKGLVCRCTWIAAPAHTSDDAMRAYTVHLSTSSGVSEHSCDQCQRGFAQVRHGATVLCATCAIDELEVAP